MIQLLSSYLYVYGVVCGYIMLIWVFPVDLLKIGYVFMNKMQLKNPNFPILDQ